MGEATVHKSFRVAERLQNDGISIEVIDPRTLVPLDIETLVNSVRKTHRAVIVHEAHLSYGPGAEIAARLADEAFDYLDAPIKRVGAKDIPIPMAPHLESYVIPLYLHPLPPVERKKCENEILTASKNEALG